MHYLLGMPLHEVASSLGIPIGTAKSRLHYALGALRVSAIAESSPAQSPVPRGTVA
jgi:DNA-directed RNA polymerase specialized sigma24 family protein